MKPTVHQLDRATAPDAAALDQAARVLAAGGLVALPTETVYGLAACTRSAGGLDRLRAVKRRPPDKPFALMVPDAASAECYVPQPPALARRLMRKVWPGPLTLVLHTDDPLACPAAGRFGRDAVAPLFNADCTVGLRCPDDPITLGVLGRVDGPVVAASANAAGAPPPRSADQVVEALGDQLDLVLDGGPAQYGVASTVLRVGPDGAGYEVLRGGLLDERTIDRLGAETWLFVCSGNTCRSPMAAAIARRRLADRLAIDPDQLEQAGYRILSAGVSAGDGAPASDSARRAVRDHGGDLGGHRSRRLTVDAVRQADRIYVMTEGHLRAVLSLAPSAADKTRLLVPGQPIEDPVGGGSRAYRQVAERLDRAIGLLIEGAADEDRPGQ